jgi:hypothetical protein
MTGLANHGGMFDVAFLLAKITEFKLEGDSDIHLVLFDQNAYLIAEMPAAQCLPK